MAVTEWVPEEEVPILDTDNYYFALEEFRRGKDQMVFVHLTVHNWTPKVFKEIIKNWKLFRECVTCPLFALGGVEDQEKWEAFVKLLGFTPLQEVICENGAKRRLFIHIKNNNKASHERQVVPNHEPVKQFVFDRSDEPVGTTTAVPTDGVQRSAGRSGPSAEQSADTD